jgi:hypothetical protein
VGRTGLGAAAAMGVAVLALAPAAMAKGSIATASETAPLSSSHTVTSTAKCPGGMHLSGGGFSVSPDYNPAGSLGTKTMVQVSRPTGKKRWVATAGALQVPISAGSFTSYARCERDSLGRLSTDAPDNQSSVAPLSGTKLIFNCGHDSHVLFGGYSTDLPFTTANLGSSQLIVVQSQRTGTRQWTISAYNASPTTPTNISGYADCELNRGSAKLTSRSVTVPITNDARTAAQPSCPKHGHAVSGGFLIAPLPVTGVDVPSAEVDVSKPSGKGWLAGIYENPGFNLPAGSTLSVYAYCK